MTETLPAPAPVRGAPASPRTRWPLIGAAAGLTGAVSTLVLDLHPSGWSDRKTTAEVIEEISRTKAHVGLVTGYLTVALLLVLAAAWRRHVEPRVSASTAARVVSSGLVAAAGALALGYGYKGMFAIYLDGGMDAARGFDEDGLYVMYVLNDFGAYIGWLGVTVAAGAMAWMALRERTISRWIGIVSLVPVLAVTAFAVATGLPGFPGVVTPVWLFVASLGLAFGRSTISR